MKSRAGSKSDENISEIRGELRARLQPEIEKRVLSDSISEFLCPLGKKLPSKEELAKRLTLYLAKKWSFTDRRRQDLSRLIENRPRELALLLQESTRQDWQLLIKTLPFSNYSKIKRARISSEEERLKRTKLSKNRYERRRGRYSQLGLIERDFGEPTAMSILSPDDPPTGPCLDSLLNGAEVKMSGEYGCLESLFGMDRHRFPKSISCVKRGRNTFYNFASLVQCIQAFLGDNRSKRRWLAQPGRRKLVLAGVIRRARDLGCSEELAVMLEQNFKSFLE